jgi:hypothetical protein
MLPVPGVELTETRFDLVTLFEPLPFVAVSLTLYVPAVV